MDVRKPTGQWQRGGGGQGSLPEWLTFKSEGANQTGWLLGASTRKAQGSSLPPWRNEEAGVHCGQEGGWRHLLVVWALQAAVRGLDSI